MDSGFVEYNQGKLNFEKNGNGTPVVFIHGFSLDQRMWKLQKEVSSKNYQVITYDLRGFGKSSMPSGSYSHQDDLRAIFEYLGIKAAHVVGLSLGGEIALDFILSYPDSILSLTLVDSSLGGFTGKVNWDVHANEVGLEKAKQNWLIHPVFSSTLSKPEVAAKLSEIVTDYSGWHWFNHDPREKLDPQAKDRLTEINKPTQILVGADDLSYYHDIASFLSNNIKGSKLIEIPNSGHMVNLEQPDKFNLLTEQFISSIGNYVLN